MITLHSLSKTFTTIKAVSSITLSVQHGEIVGLLGPNGAGKTTTMRMMAGVLPPSSGTIQIDDLDFENHESELKQRIGYLPENNPLYDDMTVEEHLHFWGALKGLKAKALTEAIDFATENTGIHEVYYRLIGELSKGYRQRTGLAQAILTRPDILLLDEPTEGLDPNQRADIQRLLTSLKKDRTVIISSHVLAEIAKLANRVIIIHNGSVVSDDSPKNLVRGRNGTQNLLVEIRGKRVISTLMKHEEVVDLTPGDKPHSYLITYRSKDDYRVKLFDTAVAEGWKLLASQTQDRQLEDVFAELTREVS